MDSFDTIFITSPVPASDDAGIFAFVESNETADSMDALADLEHGSSGGPTFFCVIA